MYEKNFPTCFQSVAVNPFMRLLHPIKIKILPLHFVYIFINQRNCVILTGKLLFSPFLVIFCVLCLQF